MDQSTREICAGKKVLLIDDDQAILFSYTKLFQRLGLDIDTVETADDAKACLKRSLYQVVIAGLKLTGMTGEEGLEIISHIRKFYPETKIILITGGSGHATIKKAYDLGVSFYFEKPVPLRVLQDALSHLGVV